MVQRIFVIVSLMLTSCTLSNSSPTEVSVETIILTPLPNDNTQTWEIFAPGLERRDYLPTPDNEITKLTALRIDPERYYFRVHYRPGEPLTIREWEAELVGAMAFVNANFFDPNNYALGLLVSDGVVYGSSFIDRGGTFAMRNGVPSVRSNTTEPYTGEPLEEAVQAFPMLVLNGEQAYTDTSEDRFTRRTVVAEDANGRIILMATPLIGLPLLDLSTYLPTTDLNLVDALNLDGGGSTLMYLNITGEANYIVTSLDPIPAVLAVYPRG